MGYERVIQGHYQDINNLTTLLKTYVDMYRLLISSTSDLNNTSIIKKSELKHAVERIDSLGDIIDDLLKAIKKTEVSYIKYCLIKSDILQSSTKEKQILNEIHKDLYYDITDDNDDDKV